MLQFNKWFDFYSSIRNSKPPIKDNSQNPSIKLVGQESDSIFLFARNDFDEENNLVTWIDILEFPSAVGSGHEPIWANLYKHKRQFDVISASLNIHRNLLAFTTRRSPDGKLKGHVDEDTAVYESFVAEVAEQGACFSLSILTLVPQSLRFLPGNDKNHAKVLCYICNGVAELYEVKARTRAGRLQITSHSEMISEIDDKVVWHQWDINTQRLYIITRRDEKNIFDFSSYRFRSKRKELVFTRTIPLKLTMIDEKFVDSLTVVPIRPSGAILCLCQVHNPQRQDNKLEVSIYFMHTNSLLEFVVEDIYENEKLLFDSTVNMLVIYLPNKYLQLIDCGPEHFAHPLPSMTFYGLWAPQFPTTNPLLTSLDVFGAGRIVMDLNTLQSYSLCVSQHNLVETLVARPLPHDNEYDPNIEQLKMALHFLIIHMNQIEMAAQPKLLTRLAEESPDLISSDVLKEFLIGMSFNLFVSTVSHIQKDFTNERQIYQVFDSLPISGVKNFNKKETINSLGYYFDEIEYSTINPALYNSQVNTERRKRLSLEALFVNPAPRLRRTHIADSPSAQGRKQFRSMSLSAVEPPVTPFPTLIGSERQSFAFGETSANKEIKRTRRKQSINGSSKASPKSSWLQAGVSNGNLIAPQLSVTNLVHIEQCSRQSLITSVPSTTAVSTNLVAIALATTNTNSSSTEPKGFLEHLKQLFSRVQPQNNTNAKQEHTYAALLGQPVNDRNRQRVILAFHEALLVAVPSLNPRQQQLTVSFYREQQVISAVRLFQALNTALTAQKKEHDAFHCFEQMHVALEELQFPSPQHFEEVFLRLAVRVLPEHVLFQYVAQGVLRPTSEALRSYLTEDDEKILLDLVHYLPGQVAAAEQFEFINTEDDFVSEAFINSVNLRIKPQIESDMYETTDFLPMSILLESLVVDDNSVRMGFESKQKLHFVTSAYQAVYQKEFSLRSTNRNSL